MTYTLVSTRRREFEGFRIPRKGKAFEVVSRVTAKRFIRVGVAIAPPSVSGVSMGRLKLLRVSFLKNLARKAGIKGYRTMFRKQLLAALR